MRESALIRTIASYTEAREFEPVRPLNIQKSETEFSMKSSKIALAIVAALGIAGSAMADTYGVKFDGNVNAASDYNFRGLSLSDKSPTLGFGVTASHQSGVYASLATNTVNTSGVSGVNQYLSALTAGYNYTLGNGVKLGAGATRYQFSGPRNAGDNTFGEVFVTASYAGFTGTLARNVDGANGSPAGFAKGDTYGSVGYTYNIGKYSLGGDVGYYWYADKYNSAAKDGVAVADLRADYHVNENLTLGVKYQADGHDAAGHAQERNNTALVNLGYRF